MNQIFDKKFFYRLRFFVLGVLLGTIVLWVIYWKDNRKKVYKWPSEIVLENIKKGKWVLDFNTVCILKQLNTDTIKVKIALDNGKVNFSQSNVRQEPCKLYHTDLVINSTELNIKFLYCRDSSVHIKEVLKAGVSISCTD